MNIVIIALTVIVSILLICIVLVQKSKGGGLSSQFGGAGSVMGVRQTNSFLEKGTWTLVGILVFLSILSVWVTPKTASVNNTRTAPVAPAAPAPALPAPGAVQTVELTDEAVAVPVQAAEVPAETEASEAPAGE